MRAGELRALSLFDGLADDQLAELIGGGTEVRVEPGADLFREGEHADFWWVLIDGAIDLVRHIGREDTVVAKMDVPGRWAGGFRAWDEHGVYLATGRGVTGGRVLRVPAGVLRQRFNAWFPFGRHLIEGVYRTARSIESTARQHGSTSLSSPWARSPPASRMRSITRQPPPPGRSTHSRPHPRCCSRPSASSPRARSRPGSSPRSMRCAVKSNLRRRSRTR